MKSNNVSRYIKTKIMLLQTVFFTLLLCIKFITRVLCNAGEVEYFYYIHSTVEIVFGILLLSGLFFGTCRYILKSKKMLITSLLMTLSLYLLYSIFEYIEALLFLPYYNVPMISNPFHSLVASVVYMCVLYVICLFWRRYKNCNVPLAPAGADL